MLKFKEDTHQYYYNDKELISVTTLLRKHGLAPDYSNVNPEVLKKKAERGTLIHKEIEDYIKCGEIGFTKELDQFIDFIEKNELKPIYSELMVSNDIVAGTIDLILAMKDQWYIADNKTTSVIHYESVSWQISIYLYLLLYGNERPVIKDYEAFEGLVFHFNNNLNVVPIPLKPKAEIERLLDCERNGIIYQPKLEIQEVALDKLIALENQIKSYELQVKSLESERNELKAAIMKAMKDNGIKSWTSLDNTLTLTYVLSKGRTTVDSKLLKENYPDVYSQVLKQGNDSESLRITIREDSNVKQ